MSELIYPSDPALTLATEVLDGVRREDERSPFAAFNFLNTVQILYGERKFVEDELASGRMSIITPTTEPGLNLVAEGVKVNTKLIALLNPEVWLDPSLFDPRLVRSEVFQRVYPATRKTIFTLFRI